MHKQKIVLQAKQSRIRHLTGVQVVSIGSYVPDNIVSNEDLAERGYDADWIIQRTGIEQRRHAPPDMATSDLAIAAAETCMKSAGVTADDIDLLVLGTFTPDMPVPATACLVQDRLGINAPAFDISAACAGFMYAMVTGMQFVATGNSNLALVIGADTTSRISNPADEKTYPLFGDGAGAVLLASGGDDQGLLSYTLGSDGSGTELLCRKLGGSRIPNTVDVIDNNLNYLQMDGRPIFKWAIRLIKSTITDVLSAAHVELDDVDLFVLHQANRRILDAAVDNLGIPREKVVVNVDLYGNTSAASVPLALDQAYREGRIKRGDRVVLSGFGAGLAWGTALLQW